MWADLKERLHRYYHQASPYHLSRKDKAVGIALTFFFFFLYLYTCSHGPNMAGDSAELIGASYSLGIVHPPGYPLYTILGYLFTRIPVGSIAFRANFSSVVYHSITLLLFYVIAVKMTRHRAASAIATAALGFSPLFWFYSLIAEVFPLNDLFVVLLLYAALRTRDKWLEGKVRDSMRSLAALAFLCGLSLCNHHTIVLLFPALVLFVLYPILQALKRPRYLLASIAAFLLGLLPYLYLPLRASSGPYINFQNPSSLSNFVKVITRQYYGTSRLWKGPAADHRLDLVFDFIKTLGNQVHIAGIALGILGIFYLARKRSGDFWPLFTALVLAGIVFPLMANVKITSTFLIGTIERFYLSPLILYAFFIAGGVAAASGWLRDKISLLDVRKDVVNAVLWVLLLLLALPFLLPTTATADKVSLNYDQVGEAHIENLVASVEEGSVVFLGGDIHIQLMEYYETCVEHEKKIYFLIEPFLANDWYADTVRTWYPDLDFPSPGSLYFDYRDTLQDIKALYVDYLIEHNPQVSGFYLNVKPRYLQKKYQLIPWGITFKILPRDEPLDYISYQRKQLDYWRKFDYRGLDHRFYDSNRREKETAPYMSLFLYETGTVLKDKLPVEKIIYWYIMAGDMFPYTKTLSDLSELYLRMGQEEKAMECLSMVLSQMEDRKQRAPVLLKMENLLMGEYLNE